MRTNLLMPPERLATIHPDDRFEIPNTWEPKPVPSTVIFVELKAGGRATVFVKDFHGVLHEIRVSTMENM